MNDGQDRSHAIKAAALLLPSPFAAIDADPAAEESRTAETLIWLEKAGITLSQGELELLERSAEEAHDALVPPGKGAARRGAPRLLHPLSHEQIGDTIDLPNALEAHRKMLEGLPLRGNRGDRAFYLALWRHVMRLPVFTSMPADAQLPDHTVSAHRSLSAALAGASLKADEPALLFLHVGPVQTYIKAARRTQDLWIGSYTVAFLTFAAARAIAQELGPDAVVSPDLSSLPLADVLLFGEPIRDWDGRANLLRASLANKVLAIVPKARAEALGKVAASAVSQLWSTLADRTREHLGLPEDEQKRFGEQIDSHLEIDVVAQPWPRTNPELLALLRDMHLEPPAWLEAAEDHPGAAYGRLFDLSHRILAAHRKGVEPPVPSGDRRPKCTVCGIREQMGPIAPNPSHQQFESRVFFEELSLRVQEKAGASVRPSLQVVHGEGLCAVCLTKRFAPEVFFGAPEGGLGIDWKNKEEDRPLLRFPSTATIATAPLRFYLNKPTSGSAIHDWLMILGQLHQKKALDFDPPGNLLRGLGTLGRGSPLLSQDGTWLHESSYDADTVWRSHFAHDPHKDPFRYGQIAELTQSAAKKFRSARGATGGKAASTYYAVIALDGDEMGQWLTGRHERMPKLGEILADARPHLALENRPLHPALHGELSRRLAMLAIEMHAVVDRHLGRVVYSGGDDLLAFLPLATALPCLDEIRRTVRMPRYLGDRVTVSAGVAISHWREPLSRALDMARDAEHAAKMAGRDRFAIHADKRSGTDLNLVLPFKVEGEPGIFRPTIEMLGEMLLRDDEGDAPLAGTKAAFRLREELPALDAPELAEAFLCRIEKLVLVPGMSAEVSTFLRALLQATNAPTIVDLLLLLRFLLREEHGIGTAALLDDLRAKEKMNS